MATYTLTAANVLSGNTTFTQGTAGETLAAGDIVYLKTSDSRLWKADSNITAAEAAVIGVCLDGGGAGQPVLYQATGAEITVQTGAFAQSGILLVISPTAGKMMDHLDLDSDFVTIVGWTTATNKFQLTVTRLALQAPAAAP